MDFFLGWVVMSISIGSVCMVGEYMYTSYDMRELKTSLSHGSTLTRPQDTAYTILHLITCICTFYSQKINVH